MKDEKMKTMKKIWALLPVAALLMLSACGSDSDVTENVKQEPQDPTGAKEIGFTVTVDNSTRASIGSDKKTLSFATGDQLLIKGTNISGLLPMTSGAGTKSAVFTGKLTYTGSGTPASSLALTATLISSENVGVNTTTGEINYGTAICTTLDEAVAKYCLLTGTSTFGNGQATFHLEPHTAYLNYTLTLPDGETAGSSKSVTVSGLGTANRTGTVTTEASGNSYVAKFVVPVAVGTSLNGIKVKVGDDATYAITNNVTAAAKVYNVTKSLIKWVQLWENGPYWADRNVGASSETDYGDYFAWGEVEPKSDYSWNTYAWGTSATNLTKYTGTSGDGKTTLEAEDDAATYNWGGNCRMPTIEELGHLINKEYNGSTWVATSTDYTDGGHWEADYNGVAGWLISGKTGTDYENNSIFLPAAGFRYVGSLLYDGEYGHYWSSSLNSVSSDGAWFLYSSSGDPGMHGNGRFYGRSVRPVRTNL